MKYPVRVKIAVALLIISFSLSNIRLVIYKARFSPQRIGKDFISLYEKRFDNIKKDLPPYDIVGYMTDKRYTNIEADRDSAAAFYLARYALAPVIVAKSKRYPLVIGNFHDASDGLKTALDIKLGFVKDYGNGLMLFNFKEKAK